MHGFRKKPELARQLLDAGIDLSMRAEHIERYPDIPRERIHTETDAPDTSLPDIKINRAILFTLNSTALFFYRGLFTVMVSYFT